MVFKIGMTPTPPPRPNNDDGKVPDKKSTSTQNTQYAKPGEPLTHKTGSPSSTTSSTTSALERIDDMLKNFGHAPDNDPHITNADQQVYNGDFRGSKTSNGVETNEGGSQPAASSGSSPFVGSKEYPAHAPVQPQDMTNAGQQVYNGGADGVTVNGSIGSNQYNSSSNNLMTEFNSFRNDTSTEFSQSSTKQLAEAKAFRKEGNETFLEVKGSNKQLTTDFKLNILNEVAQELKGDKTTGNITFFADNQPYVTITYDKNEQCYVMTRLENGKSKKLNDEELKKDFNTLVSVNLDFKGSSKTIGA